MNSVILRFPINILRPSKPICVKYDTRINEVIKKMRRNRIGCVCVIKDRKLIGIFTERDLIARVIGENLDIQKTSVAEVMTQNPEYLYYDDEIAFALNRMHVGGFRHVPLVNLNHEPIGIISIKDIMGSFSKNIKQFSY